MEPVELVCSRVGQATQMGVSGRSRAAGAGIRRGRVRQSRGLNFRSRIVVVAVRIQVWGWMDLLCCTPRRSSRRIAGGVASACCDETRQGRAPVASAASQNTRSGRVLMRCGRRSPGIERPQRRRPALGNRVGAAGPALGNVRRRAHPGRLLASAYRHVLCAPGPRTPEAERVGFEPTRPLRAHWFSRPAPSSTRPSLQAAVSHAEYGADYPATGMDFTPRRKKSGCHCRSSRSIVKCTSGILASN